MPLAARRPCRKSDKPPRGVSALVENRTGPAVRRPCPKSDKPPRSASTLSDSKRVDSSTTLRSDIVRAAAPEIVDAICLRALALSVRAPSRRVDPLSEIRQAPWRRVDPLSEIRQAPWRRVDPLSEIRQAPWRRVDPLPEIRSPVARRGPRSVASNGSMSPADVARHLNIPILSSPRLGLKAAMAQYRATARLHS